LLLYLESDYPLIISRIRLILEVLPQVLRLCRADSDFYSLY